MSEKQRRLKITIGEGRFNIHVIDMETGLELNNQITSLVIRVDRSTDFRAVAEVEFYDADIEVEANVEVETTKTYRRLE